MSTQPGKQKPLNPSLQAKLELLQNIQKGNFQRVKQLAHTLSKVNNTNPTLYSKLTTFVQKHQQELNDINQQSDDEQQPQIENVDDEFVEGKEWDSQESIEYDSDEEEKEENTQSNQYKNEEKVVNQKNQNVHNKRECSKDEKSGVLRRSASNKKLSPTAGNTFQFKSPVREAKSPQLKFTSAQQFKSPVRNINKSPELKHTSSKAQLHHKNSAIGKTIKSSSSKPLLKL